MTYAAAAAAAKSLQLCPTQCNPIEDSDAHRRTGEWGVDWGGFTRQYHPKGRNQLLLQ